MFVALKYSLSIFLKAVDFHKVARCSIQLQQMEKQILHHGFIKSTHLFGECLEMEQLLNREIIHKNEEEQQHHHHQEEVEEEEEAEELNFSTTQFLQMLQQNDDFTFTNPFLTTQHQEPTFQKLCKANIKKNPDIIETQIESCITNTNHDSKFDFLKYPTTNSIRVVSRERKKRKRTSKVCKNKEEVENQRMTHIAVERNRRRQMNDYLNTLRSLMPPSYVQTGDQASIIGGAIDFVKELEQLLQSLPSQKRLRKSHDGQQFNNKSTSLSSKVMFTDKYSNNNEHSSDGVGEYRAEKKSETANIEVIIIQTHVNLKVKCVKKNGQLLKAIVALEDLRLTVLHLNITSFESFVFYSFNLKIEDDCKIGSADRIAKSVHQIFNYINGANDSG